MDTVDRIRREYFIKGKSFKEIVWDLRMSRDTVRNMLGSGATSFCYDRMIQPMPKLGPRSVLVA